MVSRLKSSRWWPRANFVKVPPPWTQTVYAPPDGASGLFWDDRMEALWLNVQEVRRVRRARAVELGALALAGALVYTWRRLHA